MSKTLKTLLGIISVVLLIGGTAVLGYLTDGYQNWQPNTWFETKENELGVVTTTTNNGIKLALVTTDKNTDGSVVKTFSYTISPANATNQNVSVEAKYKDGTSCSEALIASVNTEEKTISLTCKTAFAQQIEVVVTSEANANATATIKVDYEKKISYLAQKENLNLEYNPTSKFKATDFIDYSFSEYTIDKNYTFKITQANAFEFDQVKSSANIEKAKNYCSATTINSIFNSDNFGDFLKSYFLNLNEKDFPTASEIWNYENEALINSSKYQQEYRLLLANQKSFGSWYYTFSGKIQAYSGNQGIGNPINLSNISIGINLSSLNFTSFNTNSLSEELKAIKSTSVYQYGDDETGKTNLRLWIMLTNESILPNKVIIEQYNQAKELIGTRYENIQMIYNDYISVGDDQITFESLGYDYGIQYSFEVEKGSTYYFKTKVFYNAFEFIELAEKEAIIS